MKHSWLVSVLGDLEAYAKTNELPWLREELIKTKLTAISELNGDLESLQALAQSEQPPHERH